MANPSCAGHREPIGSDSARRCYATAQRARFPFARESSRAPLAGAPAPLDRKQRFRSAPWRAGQRAISRQILGLGPVKTGVEGIIMAAIDCNPPGTAYCCLHESDRTWRRAFVCLLEVRRSRCADCGHRAAPRWRRASAAEDSTGVFSTRLQQWAVAAYANATTWSHCRGSVVSRSA
jgi:hypothetical protein